jgi:ABC-type bacteriocin/lantibiotic exporter with double-glycine peptidase domain
VKLVLQRAPFDCGVAALASLIEMQYEDVYVAVAAVETKRRGKSGLNLAQMIRAARRLGVRLVRKAVPSLDDDEGLLVVNWLAPHPHPIDAHLVVLGYGVIADPADGLVLPADEYLTRERARAGSLLEVVS